MSDRPHDTLTSAGLLVLRLGVGGYLMTHGWGKLQMMRTGAMFGDPIGIGAEASLVLVMFAELVCAFAIVIGVCTRLAAIPVVIAMAVAAFVAHGNDPWTMEAAARLFFAGKTTMMLSKQPALIFLVVFLTLILTGPGKFSVDAWLWPAVRRTRSGKSA